MELSWGVGLTIGPTLIGIIFDIGGYSLPFIVIGFVAFSGVYYTYYEVFLADLEKMERESLKIEGNVKDEINHLIATNNENESYMTALKYPQTIILALCLFIELNTLAFYVPTLVNYLKDSFDLSTSRASLFFLFSTFGYVLCTQVINKITDRFNKFKIIFYSLFFGAFCCLFTAPIGILPHSYILMLIGIFCEGFTQGLVNIPTFIELTNVGKKLYPHNKRLQLDIPSSVFNISFYIGDFIEPIIGSWITTNYYFQMSAYFACCCSIIFGTFFGWYFNNEINKQINDENQINLQLVDKKLSSIQNAEKLI
jgi:MFS family permease